MIHLSHHHNENSALRPQVMDDMLTLTEVPLAGVRPTALDNQVHAEILMRCFVSRYVVLFYGVRCDAQVGIDLVRRERTLCQPLQESKRSGKSGRGREETVQWRRFKLLVQIFICILDRFSDTSYGPYWRPCASFTQSWLGKRRSPLQNGAKDAILSPNKSCRKLNLA
jgi:hypothetical protein